MKLSLCALVVLFVVLSAGCAPSSPIVDPVLLETTVPATQQRMPSESTAPPRTDPPPPATATPLPVTMTPSNAIQPDLLGLPQVEQARADLALRLNVSPDDIDVVALEPKTWGDTSMGCPQPGMAYLQVPQDGLLVQLAYGGQVYNYHSGGNLAPFLCQQPLAGEKNTPVFGEDIVPPPEPDY